MRGGTPGDINELRIRDGAADSLVRSFAVVVVLETGQFSFQVYDSPEGYVIEILASDRADQALYERVRHWRITNGLYLLDLEDADICLPSVKLQQRVVVGSEVRRLGRAADDPAKHSADDGTIKRSFASGESDDSPVALVHDDHYPVGIQNQRLAAKQIDTPEAVLSVAEERQPGWATRARARSIVVGEHLSKRILVDRNVER